MKKILIVFTVLCLSVVANAQKFKVKEGSLKNIKGISAYNLEFDYTGIEIPKYDSEEDFLKDKMAKREEKEAGAGEAFRKSWFADRKDKYEPKFVESFNKRFKKGEIKVGKDLSNAKYIMKIHTTKMYPGYNVGVWRHNSEVNATITIVDAANPDKVLVSGTIEKIQGKKGSSFTGYYDFNSGDRIAECYAKMAKIFAKNVK